MSILNPFPNLLKLIRRRLRHLLCLYIAILI
nr:MAG TPA: hypothetical protein [Caudoviricetes sp.]